MNTIHDWNVRKARRYLDRVEALDKRTKDAWYAYLHACDPEIEVWLVPVALDAFLAGFEAGETSE